MIPAVGDERQICNIALTGFMGCGKSAVGRVVAKLAGFELLDTDQFIEEHVGMSIPRIFEEHGEETFRRYEREVVVRLAERENTVISTGAFTLVDGTRVRQPFRGWYLLDGTDMENNGAMPDVVIEQTPEAESAEADEQIEAAVREMLGRL